jgi:hypothetical protein
MTYRARASRTPGRRRGITSGFTAPPEEAGFEIVTEIDA